MPYGPQSAPANPAYRGHVIHSNGSDLTFEIFVYYGGPSEADMDQAFQDAINALTGAGFSTQNQGTRPAGTKTLSVTSEVSAD